MYTCLLRATSRTSGKGIATTYECKIPWQLQGNHNSSSCGAGIVVTESAVVLGWICNGMGKGRKRALFVLISISSPFFETILQ
jgi:hypothetical protein